MKIKKNIYTFILSVLMILVFADLVIAASLYNDLIKRNKTDTAVKFLKAPLSLAVVQNRPIKGFYFFYDSKQNPIFDELLLGKPQESDEFDDIISEIKVINKTLRDTDPTRLVPATIGRDHRGPITRLELRKLAKENPSDIIIIFRREFWIKLPKELPTDIFLQPAKMFSLEVELYIEIHNHALIYLARQNKILAIPSNKHTVKFTSKNYKSELQNKVQKGLKGLADKARNIIRSQRKIITKSY